MTQLTFQQDEASTQIEEQADVDYARWRLFLLPLAIAFVIDLITPQLIVWGLVPSAVGHLSNLLVLAMIGILFARMLMVDYFPKVIFVVLAVTAYGLTIAVFQGQSMGITLYGTLRWFQYPLIGLYVYMMPRWPQASATWMLRLGLVVLILQVVVQIGQYLGGVHPGDHLAGTFGEHGVASLIFFVLLLVSFGFGKWLSSGNWRYLLVIAALGAVSSALGEMKIYPIAFFLLAILAISVHVIRGGAIKRFIIVALILLLAIPAYIYLFEAIIVPVTGWDLNVYVEMTDFTDFFGGVHGRASTGFRLNRLSEPVYVWNQNSRDPASFLFGQGIGIRAESKAFGVTGGWYKDSFYVQGPGQSLSVVLIETGMVGMSIVLALSIVAIIALLKKARTNANVDFAAIQYGLVLYTILWPLWLFYLPVWMLPVPMLCYWAALGFTLNPENSSVA